MIETTNAIEFPCPDTEAGRALWNAIRDVTNLCLTAIDRGQPEFATEVLNGAKLALVAGKGGKAERAYLTAEQAAAYLGLLKRDGTPSRNAFYKLAKCIKPVATGRYRVEDLDAFATKKNPKPLR